MPKIPHETHTTVEMAVLAFLHLEPMHGYELHRRMGEPGGPGQVWRLKQGQLYDLLGKLEKSGLIESETMRPGSRPPRKVFRLAPSGEQVYGSWVKAPVMHARMVRQDFLIKLYFARREPGDIALRLINTQLTACRSWLEANRQAEAKAPTEGYPQLVHEFRAGQIEAMIEWLEHSADAEARRTRGVEAGGA